MSLVNLNIDEQSKVATVTLNRPSALNALNVPMAQALHDAVVPLKERVDLRCIAIKAEGKAFMAGGDVGAFAEQIDQADIVINQLIDLLIPVIEFFHTCKMPVVACVQGAVAGAGMSLVSACDLVIASRETRFLMAYDKIGAPPDCGGTYFLPRLLGDRRANSLMFLGDTWTAEQAEQYGLINRVVDTDKFQSECDALLNQIASGPTKAFGEYKTLAREGRDHTLAEQLEAERFAFNACTKTDDFKAGVMAFINKKPATYTGK